MWGPQKGGQGGWGAGWESFKPWIMGTPGTPGVPDQIGKEATGNLWQRSGIMGKSAIVGTGAALAGAATMPDEDLPEEILDDSGQQQYLSNRALFEDEWSDWLVDMGKAADKAEALEMVRANPMFSEGGRVKAQGGLFAGQMAGRHPGMNQMNPNMNPMGMNQGLGAPNLGSRSMGMTPGTGGGGGQDPRMAQLMQGQRRPPMRAPKESEDTELIQLIKMLTSLGIPMEQLRGRTKEELVEMLVSVKGKMGGQERPEVEEEVVEEEVVQAAQGGRIGMAEGMSPGEAQARGLGAQHHGSVTSGNLHAGNVGEGGGQGFVPGIGPVKAPPTEWKGSPEPKKSWFQKNIYDRTDHDFKARQNFLFNKGLYQGNLGIYWDGDDANDFEDSRYNDKTWLTSPEGLEHLRGMGYKGGINDVNTGGGGGGAGAGPSYTTAGGTGTTAGTTGDDYYKFAEWDKWLMPGETTTQAMMPGGYKKEILANTGGLMRTGYAMGTEHPIVPSKDGKQLDMRDHRRLSTSW